MTAFAFYDLDRTITRAPTWSAFLLFAAVRHSPARLALVPVIGAAAIGHQLGWVSRDRLKEIMHGAMLGRSTPLESVARLADHFARLVLERNVRPGALAQITADRTAGYRIVLATAAHRFYAEAIARQLGIADVIATEAIYGPDGALTNRLRDANVFGGAKLAAVKAWLAAMGTSKEGAVLRFYSDHASDAPCMAFAHEPFAVNPHRRLRKLAVANGWGILDWQAAPGVAGNALEEICEP